MLTVVLTFMLLSMLCSMGVPELLRSVVRRDGFRALYRGATPSLLGIIPYAGIAFSINEQAKHEVTTENSLPYWPFCSW